MKIHDFGLWFKYHDKGQGFQKWSTTIPQDGGGFAIYFDGQRLAHVWGYGDYDLFIYHDKSYIVRLRGNFDRDGSYYKVGRQLTLDDFEIIENPEFRGIQ